MTLKQHEKCKDRELERLRAPAHTRGPIDRQGSAQWLHAQSDLSGNVGVKAEDQTAPPIR